MHMFGNETGMVVGRFLVGHQAACTNAILRNGKSKSQRSDTVYSLL